MKKNSLVKVIPGSIQRLEKIGQINVSGGRAPARGICQSGWKKLSEEEHIAFNPFNSNLIYALRITFLLFFFWLHYSFYNYAPYYFLCLQPASLLHRFSCVHPA